MQALNDDADLEGFDIALFSAGAGTSREWAPRFVEAGATVIDNSSAFRRDPDDPAGRVRGQPRRARAAPRADRQPELLDDAADGRARADPPPSRDRAAGRRHLPVGVGHRQEGDRRTRRAGPTPRCAGADMPAPQVYPEPIAFNVIGAAGNFADGDDHTDEERKMMFETRKILDDGSIGVAVTCVRVPVRGLPLGGRQRADARAAVRRRGIRACSARRPASWSRTCRRPCAPPAGTRCSWAGSAATSPHPRALSMWIVSDNLRKGAATNAVQIAEVLVERGLLGRPRFRRRVAPAARSSRRCQDADHNSCSERSGWVSTLPKLRASGSGLPTGGQGV